VAGAEVVELGTMLPAWSALPFVGLLLSIALFPLLAPEFWHHHFPKVTAGWALLTLLPFVAVYPASAVHEVLHTAIVDYVPFLILLGALFTISGGIYVRGSLRGTPWMNAGIILTGTALASWIGTTGASMLTLRPLLRANRDRRHKAHTVVFFIFLVANVGGALTPLGDPPLFLGFLHHVPFFWTLVLFPKMLLVIAVVLVEYLVVDFVHWNREDPALRDVGSLEREPLRVEGGLNAVFMLGVLLAVIVSGLVHLGEVHLFGVHQTVENLLRDATLVGLLWASWVTTSKRVREENGFSWGAIREVAILFAGIFVTMIPALDMLRAGERGALAPIIRATQTPADFFWASGILSSFLDNAPTYLTFLSTALGRLYPDLPEHVAIPRLIAENGPYLQAIAAGSVFMGANSYIGNAPNFMVKSIAEEAGVRMPSFFGYIFKYSLPILIPSFLLVTWVFF
jgi:Na+/H+ antiporter NhaD/arsenite permease-like protein